MSRCTYSYGLKRFFSCPAQCYYSPASYLLVFNINPFNALPSKHGYYIYPAFSLQSSLELLVSSSWSNALHACFYVVCGCFSSKLTFLLLLFFNLKNTINTQNVGPEMSPYCLQRFTADDISCHWYIMHYIITYVTDEHVHSHSLTRALVDYKWPYSF